MISLLVTMSSSIGSGLFSIERFFTFFSEKMSKSFFGCFFTRGGDGKSNATRGIRTAGSTLSVTTILRLLAHSWTNARLLRNTSIAFSDMITFRKG